MTTPQDKASFPITIESAVMFCSGDESVGIMDEEFMAQCYIEVSSQSELEAWRSKFESLYSEFCDSPKCAFDFEIKHRQEAEERAMCSCQNAYNEGVRHLANDCPIHGVEL